MTVCTRGQASVVLRGGVTKYIQGARVCEWQREALFAIESGALSRVCTRVREQRASERVSF